jgi:hypothetical protein
MNQEYIDKRAELRWENERKTKQAQLDIKLKELIHPNAHSFLSFEESDRIQIASDEWTGDESLKIQVDEKQHEKITSIIKIFFELSQHPTCYLFSMKYNFGLFELPKNTTAEHWMNLIEIDGDEIFFSLPNRSDFLHVEKEQVVHRETEGVKYIYQLTYSNKALKLKLGKS